MVDKVKVKVNVKRAGRKRRVVGWGLLVLGVVVAGVWVASGWWEFGVGGRGGQVSVRHGMLVLRRDTRWDLELRAIGAASEAKGWVWWEGRPTLRLPTTYDDDYEPLADRKWWKGIVYAHVYWPAQSTERLFHARLLIWPLFLFLCVPALTLLRPEFVAWMRVRAGLCDVCGYDLAGLGVGAKCPECGKGAGAG